MKIANFRELTVYQIAFQTACLVFDVTRDFPPEEKYSLTDQIRRSSRSVCANIGEAWRKRKYKPAFLAKLNDAEAECSETQVWLDLALAHKYFTGDVIKKINDKYEHISAMLIKMGNEPQKWTVRS